MKRYLLLWCPLLLCGAASGAEWCSVESRIPIVLPAGAAGDSRPVNAFLVGSLAPGLRIIEATGSRPLWSADASGALSQRFAGMSAGFTSSLAAIDIDGDGAHDRIYAGDVAGRLWRFDIDARNAPSNWVTGGVFADLGHGATGRGFLAVPDVTLITPRDAAPWLSIAIGTANTFPALAAGPMPVATHRFYILRDRAPFERWGQPRYDHWTPLVEGDLSLLEAQRLDVSRPAGAGFLVNLGSDQVLAPALTLNGTTWFTVAATRASFLPTCQGARIAPTPVTVRVSAISDLDGNATLDASNMAAQLIRSVAPDSAITLLRDGDGTTGRVTCTVAGHALPGCALDTTLRRSFWRREDAD